MKKRIHTLALLTSLTVSTIFASSVKIDFSTPEELNRKFSLSGFGTIEGTVSLGNSSAIAVFKEPIKTRSLPKEFELSIDFLFNGNGSSGRPLALGFTQNATDIYQSSSTTTSSDIRAILVRDMGNSVGIGIFQNGKLLDQSLLDVDLESGKWYRFSLRGRASADDMGMSLEANLSRQDSPNLALKFITADVPRAGSVFEEADIYPFFGGQDPEKRGVDKVDNFSFGAR